jgi:hypothetical protein
MGWAATVSPWQEVMHRRGRTRRASARDEQRIAAPTLLAQIPPKISLILQDPVDHEARAGTAWLRAGPKVWGNWAVWGNWGRGARHPLAAGWDLGRNDHTDEVGQAPRGAYLVYYILTM